MYHPVQREQLAFKFLNSKVKKRRGWEEEGKSLAIPYKILNGEMSSNYKLLFSSYELSEPMLWEGMKGEILMNFSVQDQSNQVFLQSASITDETVRTHAR